MRNFHGFWFWPWNDEGVLHNFEEFPGVKPCFFWNFQELSDKCKSLMEFFKILYPLLPCSGYSQRWLAKINKSTTKRKRKIIALQHHIITVFITNSGFWLVNILLRKFDASPKKEMNMTRTQSYWMKKKKKRKKHLNSICLI